MADLDYLPTEIEAPCPSSEHSPNSREYLFVAVRLLGWSKERYMNCGPRAFHTEVQGYLERHPQDLITAQWLEKCIAKFENLAAILAEQQHGEK